MTRPLVLVIDDEPSIRDLIVAVLQDDGYHAIGASSGARALDLIPQKKPDLILLDLMMPGMDGREVLERLRTTPETATTPVVLMSAAPANAAVRQTSTTFLPKPFDIDHLLSTVSVTLQQSDSSRPFTPE